MPCALLTLPFVVQLHATAAILALVIGPFAIWRQRKDIWHRVAGGIWIALMLGVATTAWFIHGLQIIGPFSPIHLFALFTYRSLYLAIQHVKAGRYQAHGAEMRNLYLTALGVAGLFTLLPGRVLHGVIFGDQTILGLVVMGLIGVGLAIALCRKPRLRFVR